MRKKCIPSSSSSIGFFMFCIMTIIIVYLLYCKSKPNVIVIHSPPTYQGLGERETGEREKEREIKEKEIP